MHILSDTSLLKKVISHLSSCPALSTHNCVGLILLLGKRNRVWRGSACGLAPGLTWPGRQGGRGSLWSRFLSSGYDLHCALWGALILLLLKAHQDHLPPFGFLKTPCEYNLEYLRKTFKFSTFTFVTHMNNN